jgi:hypothetical protein
LNEKGLGATSRRAQTHRPGSPSEACCMTPARDPGSSREAFTPDSFNPCPYCGCYIRRYLLVNTMYEVSTMYPGTASPYSGPSLASPSFAADTRGLKVKGRCPHFTEHQRPLSRNDDALRCKSSTAAVQSTGGCFAFARLLVCSSARLLHVQLQKRAPLLPRVVRPFLMATLVDDLH